MQKNNAQLECQACPLLIDSIFSVLSPEEMDYLNKNKECISFKKKQFIIQEGTVSRGIYCLKSGKITTSINVVSDKEIIIGLLKVGDIFGYFGMLSGKNYLFTAAVIEDATTCFIPKEVINRLNKSNIDLLNKLLELFSTEFVIYINKLANIAQKPVRERIAEALIYIHEIYGFEENSTIKTDLLKLDGIGNIAGTTIQTTSVNLKDFKHEQLIEFDGKKIKILQFEKLEKIANYKK